MNKARLRQNRRIPINGTGIILKKRALDQAFRNFQLLRLICLQADDLQAIDQLNTVGVLFLTVKRSWGIGKKFNEEGA